MGEGNYSVRPLHIPFTPPLTFQFQPVIKILSLTRNTSLFGTKQRQNAF